MVNKKELVTVMFSYFTIFILINLSGNIYCTSFYYKESSILFTGFVTLFYIFNKGINTSLFCIKDGSLYLLGFSLLSFIISMSLTGIDDLYVGILLMIVNAILICNVITVEKFILHFINIMLFLSLISIICFTIYQNYPNIALLFPKTDAIASTNYYNAIFYVFQSIASADNFTPTLRNNGIFWEPGAFQTMINLALLLFINFHYKNSGTLKKIVVIVLFSYTIYTTKSSVGFLLLALILVYLFFIQRHTLFIKFKKNQVKFLYVIICLLCITSLYFLVEYTINRYSGMGGEFGNILYTLNWRLSLDKITYIVNEDIFYFFGISAAVVDQSVPELWNSIVYSFLAYGIPFSLLMIFGYFRFSLLMKKAWPLMFVTLIISFCVEDYFITPFFIVLLIYGVNDFKSDNLIINKISTFVTNRK